MSLTRFILPALMLGLVLSLTPSVAKASVVSGVVFGNLGSSGTSPSAVGGGSWTVSTANDLAAVGFNTGGASYTSLKLNSVTLGLTSTPTAGQTVTIYSSTGGGTPVPFAPLSGSPVSSTSSVAPTSEGGSLYKFSFGSDTQDGVTLAPNTNYWIVLDYVGSSLTWSAGSPNSTPGVQNGSTYSAIAGFTKATIDGGTTWTEPVTQRLSVSINAVPEPSTYAMAGIGAGLAGLVQLRRRKR